MSNKYLLKLTLYYGNKDSSDMRSVKVRFEGNESGHLWVNRNIENE